MIKNKKLIIILSATIIGLSLLIGGTLSFFGWEGEESSVSVNVSSGEGSCTLLSDNNVEIFPTTNKVKGRKIQLTANQKMADKAYITWTLVVNKIDNLQEESFKYELVNTTTNESYGSGDFKDITSTEGSNTITFSHSTEVLGYNRDYIFSLFLWIDGENFDNPLEMADQEFDFNMYCDITGTDEGVVEKENVLMSVSDNQSATSNFLRSDLTREQISSITFVDTNVVPISDNIKSFSVSKDENDNSVMLWYNNTPNSEGLYDVYIGSEGGKITIESGSYLFSYLKNVKSLDLSSFNSSKVTSMQSMFSECTSLINLDLSSFNTTNVSYMNYMFDNCSSLTSLDLSNFDTSGVIYMGGMFYGCKNLTTLDLSNFDTSKVMYMFNMLYNCSSLTSLDLSSFDTQNVINMTKMFYNCSSLTSLNLSNFSNTVVTTMDYMFYNCSSLTSLNLSNFNTQNVINMSVMFSGCSSLTSLDVSNFDTSNVTNMGGMFSRCSSLTSLDVSNFDTSGVTNISSMFSGCSSLTSLDVSNFDTSSVTHMLQMFQGCSSLTSLNLSNFDTSNVTNMDSMFCGCSSLINLNLSSFDTSSVTSMRYMFERCRNLTSLDMRNANFSNVTKTTDMFLAVPGFRDGVNIIIDDSQQTWFNTNFPMYTNLTLV